MSKEAVRAAADARPDLIPEPYAELYGALGFDRFALVLECLGGQYVYVPSLRSVLSCAIKARAAEECGMGRRQTHEQIARKYGYTGRYLRKVLARW